MDQLPTFSKIEPLSDKETKASILKKVRDNLPLTADERAFVQKAFDALTPQAKEVFESFSKMNPSTRAILTGDDKIVDFLLNKTSEEIVSYFSGPGLSSQDMPTETQKTVAREKDEVLPGGVDRFLGPGPSA